MPSFEGSSEPALGMSGGGIYSAEALALARYFMFSQVYYHPVRLIYDRHLQDFLSAWLARGTLLGDGTFPVDVEGHLRMTDDEVNAAMRVAASDSSAPGHHPASCIMRHRHFKVLYEKDARDVKLNSNPGAAIAKAAESEFGAAVVRYSRPKLKDVATDFPVRSRSGHIQPAISASETLSTLHPTSMDYVFIDPALETKAKVWLEQNRNSILAAAAEQEDEENDTRSKSGPANVTG